MTLLVLSLGTALMVTSFGRSLDVGHEVGSVAERDIRVKGSFHMVDRTETLARQRSAEASQHPVFDLDAGLGGRVQARVSEAFDVARSQSMELARQAEGGTLGTAETGLVLASFPRTLGVTLDTELLSRLHSLGWPSAVESHTRQIIGATMAEFIVADRTVLPSDGRTISVVRVRDGQRDEFILEDFGAVRSPPEARQIISLRALELGEADEGVRLAATLARALVRPNFAHNQLLTEERRSQARDGVAEVRIQVRRGTAIVREGDVVTQQQADMLRAMSREHGGGGMLGIVLVLTAFAALVYVSLFLFSAGFIKKFSTETRDVEALALLILLTLGMGKLALWASGPLSVAFGSTVAASSFWLLVPFAGGAMLVRILVNSETALLWMLATAILLGVLFDGQVLYSVYFLITGVTAAGGIAHTKERVNVLRAGVQSGLVGAAAALLLNLVQVQIGGAGSLGDAAHPLMDVAFAFTGGLLSAILVLGLVPIFELFGFVTDYKLLELSNLNHPLLRQLMLRAPGTYHHSVTLATLSEAAAEAIGANALQTKVACYFHDIGKVVQPNHFIENQGGGPNPHDRLQPHSSARIIISHVLDGAAIARQYQLPQPVIDGILMHHGTGLVQYFWAKALEQAEDPNDLEESDFRYPGQRPNTREAGIMFLADRVEAACRTIKEPTEEKIRGMIQGLVNSAVTDGQFEECPLTISELYLVSDAFTNTLLGIYHHRIDYPGIPVRPDLAPGVKAVGPIITLEMTNPLGGTDPKISAPNAPDKKA
jgi:putative nucleotidyltransferase with HDIG domain